MVKDCICPNCGAGLKMKIPSRLPRVKCGKCGHTASAAEFKEVVSRTVYCPECGAPYTLKDGEMPKTLKCSKCNLTNLTSKFTDTPPEKSPDDDPGDIPTDTSLGSDLGKMYRPGVLRMQSDEGGWIGAARDFELARGRNTLGRQSSASRSSIQFPTSDNYMSKNHAVVEAEMRTDATFEHVLSDAGSVNGTFHNGNRLDEGDEMVLTPGDTVRMGRTTFVFVAK